MLAAQEIGKTDAEIAELRERKSVIKSEKVKAHGIKLADFNTVVRWILFGSEGLAGIAAMERARVAVLVGFGSVAAGIAGDRKMAEPTRPPATRK